MEDHGLILRRAIKRLRASGRTWQQIAQELGFENPGVPCMIATGRWEPKERLEEMMEHLSPYLSGGTEQLAMRVWEVIRNRPGPERAISQREVALRVGIPVRVVRISTLWLLENGYAAGTTTRPPYGLYRMTKPEHVDAYAGQLWGRVNKTRYRATLVEGLDLGPSGEKQLDLAL